MISNPSSIKGTAKKLCSRPGLKFIFSLVFMFLIHLFPVKVYASHAVAAEITYSRTSGNTYVIRVAFYRDCGGVAEPASINVTVSSVSCGFSTTRNCTKVAGTGIEVPPVCVAGASTCTGGSIFGVREFIYTNTYTLPFNCSDWRFSYQICCRNAGIVNITSPGTRDQYFWATLNNLNVAFNNSPRFNKKPIPFQCVNQASFCLDFGATDANGDSLTYTMVTPQQTASTFVTFISPYTATQPISSSPPITFDGNTGECCIFPQLQGLFVMAVLVREYRNGVLIGTIQRDMQLNMTYCPCLNPLPVELVKFTGKNYNEFNLLEWTTASEKDNDYFVVERSDDGTDFDSISTVDGAGYSSSESDYSFRDKVGNKEILYYRLKQVDFNGNSTTSQIIYVKTESFERDIKLFPVPFTKELNVLFSGNDSDDYLLTIRNAVGLLVQQWRYKKPPGSAVFTLGNFDLSSGFYFLEAENSIEKRSFKVFSAGLEND